jgi:hypothetical protein
MENEEVVESGNRLTKATETISDSSIDKGRNYVLQVEGIPVPTTATENTPLLARERRNTQEDGSPPPSNLWTVAEFDLLPWWRRPSVSSPLQ